MDDRSGGEERRMSTQRKQYSAEFKARVALEALKGLKTINELASTYGVHPTQIAHWKHLTGCEFSAAQELLVVATEEAEDGIRDWCSQKNAEDSGAQPGTQYR